MNYLKLDEQLQGRCRYSRKLANNTYAERRDDGVIAIRLRKTDILTFHRSGSVTYDTGGWRTRTTKNRMNEYGKQGAYVHQKDGVWMLNHAGESYVFRDGITVGKAGVSTERGMLLTSEDDKEDAENKKKLRRDINQYAHEYAKAFVQGEIPKPGPRDCFYCFFEDSATGLPVSDGAHILRHVEESYFVPSLLVRAEQYDFSDANGRCCTPFLHNLIVAHWSGKPAENTASIVEETVRKLVRKWCLNQCGLGSRKAVSA